MEQTQTHANTRERTGAHVDSRGYTRTLMGVTDGLWCCHLLDCNNVELLLLPFWSNKTVSVVLHI